MKRKVIDHDEDLKALIKRVYTKYNGVYGYRQIQMHLLQGHEKRVNHKKVLRLMQEMGIRSKMRQKRRQSYKTIVGARVAENLLQREFKADEPKQKWVTDVTQYRVIDTWIYLSAIKDLYNGELIASYMSLRNDNQLVLQTFEKGFKKETDVTGLIRLPRHAAEGWRPNQHVPPRQLL